MVKNIWAEVCIGLNVRGNIVNDGKSMGGVYRATVCLSRGRN